MATKKSKSVKSKTVAGDSPQDRANQFLSRLTGGTKQRDEGVASRVSSAETSTTRVNAKDANPQGRPQKVKLIGQPNRYQPTVSERKLLFDRRSRGWSPLALSRIFRLTENAVRKLLTEEGYEVGVS